MKPWRELRGARERAWMTQARLAALAGLTPDWISQYETGRRKPSMDNLVRLADALRVSTDSLLGRKKGGK